MPHSCQAMRHPPVSRTQIQNRQRLFPFSPQLPQNSSFHVTKSLAANRPLPRIALRTIPIGQCQVKFRILASPPLFSSYLLILLHEPCEMSLALRRQGLPDSLLLQQGGGATSAAETRVTSRQRAITSVS